MSIVIDNETAQRLIAKIERLQVENAELRAGLAPYWGELLEARLAYAIEQRVRNEQKATP